MTSMHVLSLEQAYQLALRTLRNNGFNQAHAEAVAQNVTQGERDGCASHGLYRLLGCVRSLRAGKVSADAMPRLLDQAPAILRADAGGAFSLLAYRTALPAFIEKVRANGLAALAINRCVHFSALWADIEPLTEQGLVALACTPSHAWVTPARRFATALRHQPHRLRLAASGSAAIFVRHGHQRGGARRNRITPPRWHPAA